MFPHRTLLTTLCTCFGIASAWLSSPSFTYRSISSTKTPSMERKKSPLFMAIDYNDPVVVEEFGKVQPMEMNEMEEELLESGLVAPSTMNEMDIKLMLVEVRLRNSGKLSGEKKKEPKKTEFSSKFEEALYTKPVFKEYYDLLKGRGDINSVNVISEYLNEPIEAKERYGKDYKDLLSEVDQVLSAAKPVTSPIISFSGFPSNMGETGVKMTLEALGSSSDFECEESEDFPTLSGKITYDDIKSAKQAIEKYNGMDMGMGTTLELESV